MNLYTLCVCVCVYILLIFGKKSISADFFKGAAICIPHVLVHLLANIYKRTKRQECIQINTFHCDFCVV